MTASPTCPARRCSSRKSLLGRDSSLPPKRSNRLRPMTCHVVEETRWQHGPPSRDQVLVELLHCPSDFFCPPARDHPGTQHASVVLEALARSYQIGLRVGVHLSWRLRPVAYNGLQPLHVWCCARINQVHHSLLTKRRGGGGTRRESMPRLSKYMCTSSMVLYCTCSGPSSGPVICCLGLPSRRSMRATIACKSPRPALVNLPSASNSSPRHAARIIRLRQMRCLNVSKSLIGTPLYLQTSSSCCTNSEVNKARNPPVLLGCLPN